jgi:2-oxo-4-hydroxy-4-carboxy-5-ureidoimidazoline decarboxylase
MTRTALVKVRGSFLRWIMSTDFPPGLRCLNGFPAPAAEAEFLKCCGSPIWARKLATQRPFASFDQLVETAEKIWWSLDETDWLQAFHSHPKIGEQKAVAATSNDAQQWSESEQSGTANADQSTMDALAEANVEYEKKFGFIFIVCASGKSSAEMLASLQERLTHRTADEIKIAAGEQAKITRLRLRKLIEALR